ncbi:hypothetical protein RIF29_15396 [Crotalaria pallida]|uniref:Uncharacterized protein n=1 Tax=Crotalaria pallida TaxID=3830 RepID=A0AAN9IB53_CROPI
MVREKVCNEIVVLQAKYDEGDGGAGSSSQPYQSVIMDPLPMKRKGGSGASSSTLAKQKRLRSTIIMFAFLVAGIYNFSYARNMIIFEQQKWNMENLFRMVDEEVKIRMMKGNFEQDSEREFLTELGDEAGLNHVKPSSDQESQKVEPVAVGRVEGVHADVNASMAPVKQGDVGHADSNIQNRKESIHSDSVEDVAVVANFEEDTHGDWLVVTRKKRTKPKNPRGLKSNDKDKMLTPFKEAREKVINHEVGPVEGKVVSHVDNVIKRGPGIKNVTNERGSSFKIPAEKFVIQPGNFGPDQPTLKKDLASALHGFEKDSNVASSSGELDMEMVPETQLVFDPGQTKFNPAFLQ